MNLNDLPDEILCTIFDHLDVYELKLASLVCRRWSDLTFSGRRMDRVLLVKRDCNCEFLFNTKRNYRNVRQPWVKDDQIESLVRLLHTIKPHVRMLDIQCGVTTEHLGSILLEVPALQHLLIDYCSDQNYRKNNAPFRVLRELKSPNRRQLFSFFRTNIPNLQCLEMNCCTDFELDAWKYCSGQLKLAHVSALDKRYLHPFLELSFPSLEDLAINKHQSSMIEEKALGRSNDFFRRHPFLKRLFISDIVIPVEWVESFGHHCPELTHLYLSLNGPYERFSDSLLQLRKLKHFSLEGKVDREILRGAMKSLESVELRTYHCRVLLRNLSEFVPRLSCLEIFGPTSFHEFNAICKKFACLRRLKVTIDSEFLSLADDCLRLDKLMHLQELKLSFYIKIRSIHRNNVRCLTISCIWVTDEDLYQIPRKFPLLERLIILGRDGSLSAAAVELLHKLMPSCRIDWDDKRFYPIVTAGWKTFIADRKCTFGRTYKFND